jgi:hypothetical protein
MLSAAGDDQLRVAAGDGPRRERHGVEPRAAQAVDRRARNAVRNASQQARHPRDVAVVFAGLVGAAEVHVIDSCRIERAVARDQGLDRAGREIIRPHRAQRPAVAANGRAHGITDVYGDWQHGFPGHPLGESTPMVADAPCAPI